MLRGLALALALGVCACDARLEQRRAFYTGSEQLRYQGCVAHVEDHSARAECAWRFWYRNGALQALGDFNGGALVRDVDEESDRTTIPLEGRSGRWTTWNERGVKISEGSYRSGVREGVWFEWYDDGALKRSGEFVRGRATGLHMTWHANGAKASEGEFRADGEQGLQSEWDENGVLRQCGAYDRGLPIGVQRTWDECGTLREEATFKDRFIHGTRRLWDVEGRLTSSAEYVRGVQHGLRVLYHRNGVVKQVASFSAGHEDELTAYDEDGRKAWELDSRADDAQQRFTAR